MSYGTMALDSSSGTKAVFKEVEYDQTGTPVSYDGKMVSDGI